MREERKKTNLRENKDNEGKKHKEGGVHRLEKEGNAQDINN